MKSFGLRIVSDCDTTANTEVKDDRSSIINRLDPTVIIVHNSTFKQSPITSVYIVIQMFEPASRGSEPE